MKRLIAVIITVTLFVSNGTYVYADDLNKSTLSQKKIMVYLKPDLTVELNGIKQAFYDSMGKIVYPIIYNGSTYLPVRAVSGLMKEPIEWDQASKTVFIGKTLSNPNKIASKISVNSAITDNTGKNTLKSEMVNGYLKPDVLIMYDFKPQYFCDLNGDYVYPIIYNGATYLPIRAISELMKEPIEWDGTTKTISIGDGEDIEQNIDLEEEIEISIAAKKLKSLFEREEILYYEATAKTTSLKEATSLDEKQLIAEIISENYISAQNMAIDIKMMDTSEFNTEELSAYDKLTTFAESTEYYILVLENIAYLAAQDTDYSMLAETFLYFAMDSQAKMEEAREIIQDLSNDNQ